jgi:membrane fusion protein (multidrug efflux system)
MPRKHLALGALALVGLAFAAYWVYLRATHVYMDDARIDGEVVTVSSLVAGQLTELPVNQGDEVKAGQLLARIDSREAGLGRELLQARMRTAQMQVEVAGAQGVQADAETLGRSQSEENRAAAAQAEVASAQLQLAQARSEFERAKSLTAQQWLSPQALERAQTDYRRAQENHRKALAEVEAARGSLASAQGSRKQLRVIERQQLVLQRQLDELRAQLRSQEVDIANRTIAAPADGGILMTFVHAGEYVTPGQRILMFHDPRRIWVDANVKETDFARLQPGMKAKVHVDAFPNDTFDGVIQSVGKAATAKFALLPNPNPSGTFTKITQRLPVRIRIAPNGRALRPGMMVEVDVDARDP